MESESAMNPAEIPGWGKRLFPLYDLAVRRFPSGSRFVEIGCFLGMSACYGAQAIKKSRKKIRLDCIDEWGGLDNWALNNEHEVWSFQGALEVLEKARKCVLESREPRCYEAFLHNLERCNVADTIEPLNMSSAEASRRYETGTLDFVLIDADHSYESVKNDLELWRPKVKKGGIICGDDFNAVDFPGVAKAVTEFFSTPLKAVESPDDIGYEKNCIWEVTRDKTWLVLL